MLYEQKNVGENVQFRLTETYDIKVVVTDNGDGTFTYTYVSVDDQDRNFPQKMYRFPMPSGELNNNALVEQYPEWK